MSTPGSQNPAPSPRRRIREAPSTTVRSGAMLSESPRHFVRSDESFRDPGNGAFLWARICQLMTVFALLPSTCWPEFVPMAILRQGIGVPDRKTRESLYHLWYAFTSPSYSQSFLFQRSSSLGWTRFSLRLEEWDTDRRWKNEESSNRTLPALHPTRRSIRPSSRKGSWTDRSLSPTPPTPRGVWVGLRQAQFIRSS